jgi:hypothetical protein
MSPQGPEICVQLKVMDRGMTLYISQMKNMNVSWYNVYGYKN